MEEEIHNAQESSSSLQAEQSRMKNRISGVLEEKDILLGEQIQLLEKKTALELSVKDLGEEVEQQRSAKVICLLKIFFLQAFQFGVIAR